MSNLFEVKHGMTKHRLYNIWMHMKMRCNNPKNLSYKDYGARGIKICKEWEQDFINFKNDMYDSYLEHVEKHGEKNTTIERLDFNGNYEPNNCVWATKKVQANNLRKLKKYEYKGQLLTITQICELEGKDYKMVYRRIHDGWDFERALNTPKIDKADRWKERKTHGRPKKEG